MRRKGFVKSKPRLVLPPDLPRGETEFQEKRIVADFEAVFHRITEMGLASMKDTYEFAYRYGFVAGRNAERMKEPKE